MVAKTAVGATGGSQGWRERMKEVMQGHNTAAEGKYHMDQGTHTTDRLDRQAAADSCT